jgi:hypothetical protein
VASQRLSQKDKSEARANLERLHLENKSKTDMYIGELSSKDKVDCT